MTSPAQVLGLKRCLSLAGLISYGLAILTAAAAYPFVGVIQQTSNGHTALNHLVWLTRGFSKPVRLMGMS